MTRTRTLERGVEEWSCTQCGRRLLFRGPPAFDKIVLERGDEWAAHVGAGHRPAVAAQAGTADPAALPEEDRSWLAAHGIGWEPDDMP
jgi:hypothetical protein